MSSKVEQYGPVEITQGVTPRLPRPANEGGRVTDPVWERIGEAEGPLKSAERKSKFFFFFPKPDAILSKDNNDVLLLTDNFEPIPDDFEGRSEESRNLRIQSLPLQTDRGLEALAEGLAKGDVRVIDESARALKNRPQE